MVAISTLLYSAAHNNLSLQQIWETIDKDSCPYHYNFHMHTTASDGKLSPIELVEQAIKIGLKSFAITDHHSVDGYEEAKAYLNQNTSSSSSKQSILWTGIEITSRILGVEVHILGYDFDPQHPALRTYLKGRSPQGDDAAAKKVIASIQQAGGLAVLAHPHRYRRPAADLIPLAAKLGIDGVEAYYAYGNPYPWQPTAKKTQATLDLASQYNLYTTCGTDTHGRCLLQRV